MKKTAPLSANLQCALEDAFKIKIALKKARIYLRNGDVEKVNELIDRAVLQCEFLLISSADLRKN
ncbi:MAG: hypothetical protein HQM08_30365 [Candidatus Riflebacteria bacterium]|nr:hypothetical protein [Candidatus Riflebacteria bacterium]